MCFKTAPKEQFCIVIVSVSAGMSLTGNWEWRCCHVTREEGRRKGESCFLSKEMSIL